MYLLLRVLRNLRETSGSIAIRPYKSRRNLYITIWYPAILTARAVTIRVTPRWRRAQRCRLRGGKVMPTRIHNRGAVADPAAISSGCNVNRFGASPANRPSDSRLIAHNYRLLPHLLSHILLPDDDPTPLPGSNIIWRLTHRLLMQFLVAKILHHHCFLYLWHEKSPVKVLNI